ncbi:hypothetical protein KLP40_18265 [Hymenobacter sp. NST-14]|uniref:hypothetical protein n=1 Tax=Hymenobacter piscis TaxID=2839984 RepID=UPI001C028A79|nr:hypothetical protein [Hymenobacter piscis]MBT9395118.1 hypothetical protein [Hymenobacter piscis]
MFPLSSSFRLLPLLGLLGGLAACQPDSAAQHTAAPATSQVVPEATRTSVMQHHDALMGRMDALTTERQRLQRQLPTLDSASAVGRGRARTIRRRVLALQQADAAMMEWMHRYREPDTTRLSAHQYQDFWADQAGQLTRLEQQMRAALDSAHQLR